MDITKTFFGILSGMLVVFGSGFYASNPLVELGIPQDKQLFAGAILFIISMAIHIAGGGTFLPSRK